MPMRARSVFGKILASMTSQERSTVQRECTWSKRGDVPDSVKPHEEDSRKEKRQQAPETVSNKKKRQQMKRKAEQQGLQYGKSRHAIEDDDMWNLMSDTIVLKGNRPRSISVTTSPMKSRYPRGGAKRPSTAPLNPFHTTRDNSTFTGNLSLNVPRRLNIGVSSPSFYGSRKKNHGGNIVRPITAGSVVSPLKTKNSLLTQSQPLLT
jgi:hypothetical protein